MTARAVGSMYYKEGGVRGRTLRLGKTALISGGIRWLNGGTQTTIIQSEEAGGFARVRQKLHANALKT